VRFPRAETIVWQKSQVRGETIRLPPVSERSSNGQPPRLSKIWTPVQP
jgi:hypothetical protein